MKWLIILLLLIPVVTAQTADEIFSSESLTINLDISGTIDVRRTGSQFKVDYVLANLTMHPIDTPFQMVQSDTSPAAISVGEALLFRWEDAQAGELAFSLDSEINTQRNQPKIRRKIPFPTEFPEEVREYALPSKNIDAEDPDIVALAEELASGEDDLYRVVHKFAAWTQSNIEYNLSTLTSEATLPASWVLNSRQGVCDELTVLFLALNRAVGIPSRFVSGMSYTDSPLFDEEWGLHGWSEVYFPGEGWVPFDVTYGELGFTDASHIALLYSSDPTQATTRYEWRSRDANIETNELDIETTIRSTGRRVGQQISITADPVERAVRFGSYNLVELTLRNLQNFYVSVDIIISNTEGLTVEHDGRRIVLLGPNEVRTEYYLLHVTNDLQKNLLYTFPVAFLANGERVETSFQSGARDRWFSKSETQALIPDQDTRVFSSGVNLDCVAADYYTFEEGKIDCAVTNTGNTALRNLNVCHDSCQRIDIGIGKSKTVTFSLPSKDIGEKREQVSASGSADANTIVPFAVLDEPAISIANITTPEQVRFHDIFKLQYSIQRDSYSIPESIVVTTGINAVEKSWRRDDLTGSQHYSLEIHGSLLKSGVNDILIEITYVDKRGNSYTTTASHQVELVDVTLVQHIQIFLMSFDSFIKSLF